MSWTGCIIEWKWKSERKEANLKMIILLIIYVVVSYRCLNYVWYSRRIYIVSDSFDFYLQKLFIATIFGWAIIPLALLMKILKI